MERPGRLIELERPPIIETAVLARLVLPSDTEEEVEDSLQEMRQLAWTAGAEVACMMVQRRDRPCPATLIGQGKAEQIKAAVDELNADFVIFDSDLTPAQGVKLEKLLGVKVVDRTQLILDIFAQRAHTNEGKHQVELAQLQYMLPRLVGRGSIMRQYGGIGARRGPGEQKLEVDRRVIRKRITRLSDEIENIRKTRKVQRQRRIEGPVTTLALVGYTNAGKSSLLNRLANTDTFVEDKLFATLDPRARRCRLPSQREVVLTDTVGFIRKLPHSLVASFRATLEEVKEADLLLLVADAAHAGVEDHIRTVYDVLEEIDALDRPILMLLNKIDIAEADRVSQLMRGGGPRVAVSARTGEGCETLLAEIERLLGSTRSRVRLRIPQSEAGLVARVYKSGQVFRQDYEGNDIVLEAEIDTALEGVLTEYIACT